MSDVRVQVLGTFKVSRSDIEQPRLSKAVRRLIALVAAAGPDGIDRDELAIEMWGDPPPESWKSAIRNRMTAARKILGADTILNQSGRFCFADFVQVDSWDLIAYAPEKRGGETDDFAFLQGEPLMGIKPSRLVTAHIAMINDARAAIMHEVLRSTSPLSPRALQSLRSYQRAHALEATITRQVVRAHVQAGHADLATEIVNEVKASARGAKRNHHAWIDQLDGLIEVGEPKRRSEDNGPSIEEITEATEVKARAALFAAAAREEDWSLALEVAMAGLPAAERIGGDPERLQLLEAIPLDKLDPARKFSYCLTLARHLMYSGRDAEAIECSLITRSLVTSPEEELLASITGAIVGDSPDERAPIPLPAAFDDDVAGENVSMQSLQVAVMSNLERSSFEVAARLRNRFMSLVEASADPYRRWHRLLLESMTHFVEGDLDVADEVATRAYQYGDLFGIVDAEIALIGQRSNAHWINPALPGVEDYATEYSASADSRLSRVLQAIALAPHDGGAAVNTFARSLNYNSRSFFVFPIVTLIAAHVTDLELAAVLTERLKKRTGTSAIWGTGVLHLGPVDRVIAQLTDNPVDQEMHMAAAVRVADHQNLKLWQVVCRLDLAHRFGAAEHRLRAIDLATTPSLQEIVETYPGAL